MERISTTDGKGRLIWADLLKIIAVYAVILIHSAAPYVTGYETHGLRQWWAGNFYDSLSRWCIPVFIMLSGFFLIGKYRDDSMGSFFLRRFTRVFVPFIVWSFFYFLWRIYANGEELRLSSFIPMLFMEPVYYHLWYMYLLMGLYLVAPFMGLYMKNARRLHGWYYLALWFAAASALPFVEAWFNVTTYISSGTGNSIFKFIGYFALGWMLRDYELKTSRKVLFLMLFAAGLSITAYGTYFTSIIRNGGRFSGIFYEYFSFSVFMMAISIFLMVKSMNLSFLQGNPGYAARALSFIAACVPGVYLVHAAFIAVAKRGMLGLELTPGMTDPFIGIPVFSFFVFIASLLTVAIIRSLPAVRYIVPSLIIPAFFASSLYAAGAGPVKLIDKNEFKTLTGFAATSLKKMDDLKAWEKAVPQVEAITIESSHDREDQKALFYDSGSRRAKPLLIVLHSWSEDYRQSFGIPYGIWALENDWVFMQPDYRGPFDNPSATASEAAILDILDALEYAKKNADIDVSRVYIAGFSGGAMTALIMAGKYPDKWAGVVSWGAVYDLVDWYGHTKGASHHYSKDITASCGGPPEHGNSHEKECRKRSPSEYLKGAKSKVPVYIAVGLDDSFVPPAHSLRAFNDLADGKGRLSEEVIESISKEHRLPPDFTGEFNDDLFEEAGVKLLHERDSNGAVLKIYKGRHDVVYNAALSWLAAQKR
ncbi:O-acetyltransferase WecH [uncultured bacterium]|nr:O-acetyltransferase WecH [uncultured bacterium]